MEQRQIGGWLIEFDPEQTRSAYYVRPFDLGCTCHTCRNFAKAVEGFPPEVSAFFSSLGAEIAKPSEIYECEYKDEIVLYGGFYHITGNYLSGDDIWQPAAKDMSRQNTTEMFKLSDGFEIGFTKMIALVPDGFPEPVLQIEVLFRVPWVLEEPYNTEPTAEPSKKFSFLNIALGVCLGTIIGAAAGMVTDNIGWWLPLGICFGLAAGSVWFTLNKRKKK
ncbi:MAG: hypothetical protein LBQ91_06940 [Oscillospiraceae bacterium]|jgi:hypothetical protein|nr:hypothetical protein [Oscillospiraceae bacterium]